MKKKIAILTGGGSRVPSLLNQFINNQKIEIVLVVSHKKDSPGLDAAAVAGIKTTRFLIKGEYENIGKTRADLETDVKQLIQSKQPDLIVMTGWMLVLSDEFLKGLPPVINVHPALSPSFPGGHGIEDALAYGAKVTGVTVHFVPDGSFDSGPVIFQQAVEITDDDTADTLRPRVQAVEDELLPRAIELFCADKLKIEGRKVIKLPRFDLS
ncbi:phosphoribosylglycinamide formyltransferase [Candidatus Berkelbacteria bacterium]|nr:phosphoribosylglycinamide formyltransferase [Candidatus Berkelbacteria bacterium]